MKMKVCTKCKELKDLSEFHKTKQYKDGLKYNCKACSAAYGAKNRHKYKTSTRKMLLYQARHRAKKKGLPFNIELEDIVIPKFCPVLGLVLKSGKEKGRKMQSDNSPTLDKIIPELGYVKGNIMVISWRANNIKSNGKIEEFEEIIRYMRNNKVTYS